MKKIIYFFNYLFSFVVDLFYFVFGNWQNRIRSFRSYRVGKIYPDFLQTGNAAEGGRFLAEKYCLGRGVDVGAGNWPFFGARIIENNGEENAFSIKENDGSLDFVFSSHCLEHLDDWQKALVEWNRVLKGGGILFLYLPHPACSMWKPENNKFHKWSPEPKILEDFLINDLKMKILEITYLPDAFMSFAVVAQKNK